jgi:transmembrane sensor
MVMAMNPRAAEEAIGWLIRQREPQFVDWDGLTAWLESDPANAAAYDEFAAREDAVAERLSASGITHGADLQDKEAHRVGASRRGFVAGLVAVAASAAALFGLFQLQGGQDLYPVATAPGVQQTLTLAGGTTVKLNGGTKLTLDRDDPRYAKLIEGEALFAVVHDSERPFRVDVNGAELVDLGTRFNVVREGDLTEVAVSEGVVMYNPGREAIRLTPGKVLRATDSETLVRISEADPAAVGSWAEGRLVYDNVPLSVVASDLSRTIGVRVRAEPEIAARPVTAVVQIPEDREQLAPRLEKLLNLKVRQTKGDWILATR